MRATRAILWTAAFGLAVTAASMFAIGQAGGEARPGNQPAQTQPEPLPTATGGAQMAILRAHLARMDRIDRLLRNARVTAQAGNVLAVSEIDSVLRLIGEDQTAMRLYMTGIADLTKQRHDSLAAVEQELARIQDQLSAKGEKDLADKMSQVREQVKNVQSEGMPGFGRPPAPSAGR